VLFRSGIGTLRRAESSITIELALYLDLNS
jgi:hypothetical protein